MNDMNRGELDAETPVNPYSLLEAVNRSSDSASAAWLIYVGLMSYLLITVAGITHKDLLLNADIPLPILQVKINLRHFFLFAPMLLVLVHMGLIGQLVLLARKTLEFAAAVRMLETTDQRTHPLRLELDNFFFVQSLAGPERSPVVGFFLNAMSWLTLVLMPVALIAYVQVVFLPYHDPAITWVHRLALIGDIAFMMLVGVFLLQLETSFLRAFLLAGIYHPLGFLLVAVLLAAIGAGSLFVATIPGEGVARYAPSFARLADDTAQGAVAGDARRAGTGRVLGLFHRNLDVVDADLVVDKEVTPGEPSVSLRGRDLRFARLDRTDLHQADLTGANLDGASLVGADLRNAWVGCADLGQMLLANDRRVAGCASARAANFSNARLNEARMAGADLAGARLDEARLGGAQLAQARLAGATFTSARLDGADLSGAELSGANFLLASLQGANLSGARLQMADFGSASMQGANLSLAGLEGTLLRGAEMEGANLAMARLIGADLAGARMQGADLTQTLVWRTTPPGAENAAFADMAEIKVQPPAPEDLAAMKASIDGLEDAALRARLEDGLAPLMDPARNTAWAASPDQQLWRGFVSAVDPAAPGVDGYKTRLTDYLMRLMCRARFADGAVAAGVAHRAMAPGFKGDLPAIHDKLKAADCPASSAMSRRIMRDLAIATDTARGGQ
jgi:uncharacterized protein YjbI with pentapeptide repeats